MAQHLKCKSVMHHDNPTEPQHTEHTENNIYLPSIGGGQELTPMAVATKESIGFIETVRPGFCGARPGQGTVNKHISRP